MEEKIFTEEELGKYDGQNGNPAYVAIDGVVYDVTDVSAWNGGVHHGNKATKTSARSSRNRRMAKRFWKSSNGSENWRIRNFSSQRICAKK